jgi:3-hydroxybutyryl-CoA dehydratase
VKKGDKFEHEFVVTDKVYNSFISTFGDKNPLHTDPQYAQTKGFESEVMHGNILGGFLSYFIGECLPYKNVIIHSQEIKYSKPIYRNEYLIMRAEICDVFSSVNAMEIRFSFEKKNSAGTVAKGKIQIGII